MLGLTGTYCSFTIPMFMWAAHLAVDVFAAASWYLVDLLVFTRYMSACKVETCFTPLQALSTLGLKV